MSTILHQLMQKLVSKGDSKILKILSKQFMNAQIRLLVWLDTWARVYISFLPSNIPRPLIRIYLCLSQLAKLFFCMIQRSSRTIVEQIVVIFHHLHLIMIISSANRPLNQYFINIDASCIFLLIQNAQYVLLLLLYNQTNFALLSFNNMRYSSK